MAHLMEKMMGGKTVGGDEETLKGETKEAVNSLTIQVGDGEYSYSVDGGEGGSEKYTTKSVDELLGWIKDDLESPHMKERGEFASLRDKIMNKKGFKPRYAGQSKKEAASAITASVKDKSMPGWRHDRGG